MSTPLQPLRVLIIEGASDNADFIRRAFKRAGYRATLDRVGDKEALSNLGLREWDFVLLDLAVAYSNPEEILRSLRRRGVEAPCIALAVGGDENVRLQNAELAERMGAVWVDAADMPALISTVNQVRKTEQERQARRQIEAELHEVEQRFRTLTEGALDVICEVDGDGRYMYLSPNYPQVLGYSGSDLLSTSFFSHLHPDDRENVTGEFAAALAALRAGEAEYRYRHKNGDWRWFRSTLQAAGRNDEQRHVLITSREVTSHKRHEAELGTLIALAKNINAQHDLPSIARELTAALSPLLPFDHLCIALKEDEGLRLAACHYQGEEDTVPQHAGGTLIRREEYPDCPVWEHLRLGSVYIENDYQDDGCVLTEGARAFLHVPLGGNGHCIGLLHFGSSRPYVYTEAHMRLVKMAGEQVAVAVRQTEMLVATRQAEAKYRTLVQDVDAVVYEAEPENFAFTFVSPQAEEWLGYPVEQWQEDAGFWTACIHQDDRARVLRERAALVSSGQAGQLEYRVLAADGRMLWLRDFLSVEMTGAQPTRLRGLLVNISQRKRAEADLLESHTVLQATQEASADGICLMNEAGVIANFNRRFAEMWGIAPLQAAELQESEQMLAFILSRLEDPEEFLTRIEYLRANPKASSRSEIQLKDDRTFERYSAPALSPGGQFYGQVWTWRDITEQKRDQERLLHQAFHDPLTGLPNRTLFMERLTHALERIDRTGKSVAVLFLDLDRFKVVNDSLGHDKGDQLLIKAAKRLKECMRPSDTAARFGGDEFTFLLEDCEGVKDATQVAERVAASLDAPFDIDGREVYVTTSVGIVLSSSSRDRADDLLRSADVAMYRAKNKGKACYEVFDMAMSVWALERLQLEIELRRAVRQGQLELHYQPLVDLDTDCIIGVEALVRWHHPQKGSIPPDEFIPLAEESGIIGDIGRWVLREACGQMKIWQQEHHIEPPLRMSVNLSAKQFQQPGLVEDVARILKETELDASALELEITESTLMEDGPATIDQLTRLKALGVKLAIDDFGTGYSSLSYIERFPLDVLKIDRTFVNQIGKPNGNGLKGDSSPIMQAVSTLGLALGVKVTAEGIETKEQLVQLRKMGCHTGQGYLFARPQKSEDVTDLLRENRCSLKAKEVE